MDAIQMLLNTSSSVPGKFTAPAAEPGDTPAVSPFSELMSAHMASGSPEESQEAGQGILGSVPYPFLMNGKESSSGTSAGETAEKTGNEWMPVAAGVTTGLVTRFLNMKDLIKGAADANDPAFEKSAEKKEAVEASLSDGQPGMLLLRKLGPNGDMQSSVSEGFEVKPESRRSVSENEMSNLTQAGSAMVPQIMPEISTILQTTASILNDQLRDAMGSMITMAHVAAGQSGAIPVPEITGATTSQQANASVLKGIGSEPGGGNSLKEAILSSGEVSISRGVVMPEKGVVDSATKPVPPVADSSVPGVQTASELFPDGNKSVQDNTVNTVRDQQQEAKQAAKGETVVRQLPSGVSVLNPAQTELMSRGQIHGSGITGRDNDRAAAAAFREEGDKQVDKGSKQEPDLAGTLKKEVISGGDSIQGRNAEFGNNNRNFAGGFSQPGLSESTAKNPSESHPENGFAMEKSALHESILSQVRQNMQSGKEAGQVTLKLNPRELGDLQISVRMEDQKVHVEVTAQNQVVREALLQNLDVLKDTLSKQNISVERFDVLTGNGQGADQSFREGRQATQRQFDGSPFQSGGYHPEESAETNPAYWETGENSLIDMRL